MIATHKHSQLILLEPAKADLLENLAKERRTTKQDLLRRAVDNLLAMRGVSFSKEIFEMREQIKECRRRIARVLRKYRSDADVNRACGEANLFLAALLAELGDSKATKNGD